MEAHHLGDIYLETVGNIIRNKLRNQDLAFRIGGDEFTIIVRDSFSEEDFKHIVERIHNPLNSEILRKTLQSLLKTREIMNKDGTKEREGSIAIRQFVSGLKNLKEDHKGKKAHFIAHGRGSNDEKNAFLERLNIINLNVFNNLITDLRPASILNSAELQQKLELEKSAIKMIENVLSNLGVSTAALYLNASHNPSFHEIQAKLEELVYTVKRGGGRYYFQQKGLK